MRKEILMYYVGGGTLHDRGNSNVLCRRRDTVNDKGNSNVFQPN